MTTSFLVMNRSLEMNKQRVIELVMAEKTQGFEKSLHVAKPTAERYKNGLDCARTQKLFRRHSYLCSLHTYATSTASRRRVGLSPFLEELLLFEDFNASTV
jgi:hypothetical protein